MSSEPHIRPRCEGNRQALDRRSGQMQSCPTCGGQGVVGTVASRRRLTSLWMTRLT